MRWAVLHVFLKRTTSALGGAVALVLPFCCHCPPAPPPPKNTPTAGRRGQKGGRRVWGASKAIPALGSGSTEHPLPRARGSRYGAAARCSGGPGCSSNPPPRWAWGHCSCLLPIVWAWRGAEAQASLLPTFILIYVREKSARSKAKQSSEALVGTAELLTQS